MSVRGLFWQSVINARRRAGRHSVTGWELAWAASHVLGAQAAAVGLGVGDGAGMVWAASADAAAVAEHAQFTTGEGPCYQARREQHAVIAGTGVIERSWPGFADIFFGQTPFRSVVAVPLHEIGVMDLYYSTPMGCLTIDSDAATVIAGEVSREITHDTRLQDQPADNSLLVSDVSVAVGILTAAGSWRAVDGLAVLRAHAFVAGRTVEDVAADLVAGRMHPDRLDP